MTRGVGRQIWAVLCVLLFSASGVAFAEYSYGDDDNSGEVAALKTQVKELLQRIEKLESAKVKEKEAAIAASAETEKPLQELAERVEKLESAKPKEPAAPAETEKPRVDMDKITSKLKVKGRWAAGYFDGGRAATFSAGTFEVPEAKVMFTFEPDDINKLVIRMNLNNATFNNLDLFFIDTDLKKFFGLPLPLSARVGRMKLDFGEETWANNPIESVLASNSATNTNGNDEGVQLSGKIGKEKPLTYALSVTNGTTGTGTDTSTPKAFTGKLSYNVLPPLYLSASYYNSGPIGTPNAELGFAGLLTRPTGATDWTREIWEVDLRYDFKKGKTLNPPAYSDSKAILRLAYGGFTDEATGAADRRGHYGFIEGTYNFTKKFFTAARASFIELDDDTTASLNSITANEYQRYSLGVGYRFTDATHVKLGYDWNRELGASTQDADNNQFSAIVASLF